MKKILALTAALFISTAAMAADNAVVVTPGSGVTMKSKDVGAGVQAMQPIISDASGNAFGVTGNPIFMSFGTGVTLPAFTSTPTFNPGNVANTTAWLVTGTGGVFPATQSGTWNINAITTLPALVAGSAIIGKVGIDQTTVGTTNGVSIAQIGTATVLTGNGTSGAGAQRVNIASDNTPFGVLSSPQAISTGGASTSGVIAPATPAAVAVKGSAATIYSLQLFNIGAASPWLKIYDSASATCGSGTPIKRILIPQNSTAANGGGTVISFGPAGIVTSTGFSYCITGLIADADTTAIGANTVAFNADYK